MSTVDNVIMDSGGSNQFTIDTTRVERDWIKQLVNITPPQSSSNFGSGPKSTIIVDLLRVEKRFTITGSVAEADRNKPINVMEVGGTVVMSWDSTSWTVNVEKVNVVKDTREDDNWEVKMSVLVGVNLGS